MINFKKLKKLPVLTEDKIKLGKISDLQINSNDQSIEKFIVSSFGKKDLLIAPSQIVKITNKFVIVKNSLVNEKSDKISEPEKNIQPAMINPVLEKTKN